MIDLHTLLYKKRRHVPIAQDLTMSSCIAASWQFKGRTSIDKAHKEGQVNREDRIIRVHTQIIIVILLSIKILCSMQDLGRTLIKCILHLTTLDSKKIHNCNPTWIQDSRHISYHTHHTLKLHDQLHHQQIRFWMRSLSWWRTWTKWTHM